MPTIKQKIAFQEVLNGSSISRAMIKAKYSPTTASTTGKLTNTKGWEELMEQFLPDKDLAKVHKEGLKAVKKQFKNNNSTGEIEEVAVEPDYAVRHKYLETGYKLKGRLKDKEEKGDTFNTQINIFNEEQAKAIAERISRGHEQTDSNSV